ncbi:flagellar biosynthesis protein [uncultured Desulfobacterium sp.]|uniref:Flagellar biosynthetic protein FliQ n=1 Tax=uncultured Desulfobacterium sp. TaxID=201089 RepID=A0A445MTF8_9BACT|nr:flagellar biosynthesis protein [uncultured Desulfobacterium sp.]
MTYDFLTGFFGQAIKLTLLLSAPMLVTGLVVGLIVSIIQTATQLNEMTMTFVPKIVAVGIAILFFFPWMMQLMTDYTQNLFINLNSYIR